MKCIAEKKNLINQQICDVEVNFPKDSILLSSSKIRLAEKEFGNPTRYLQVGISRDPTVFVQTRPQNVLKMYCSKTMKSKWILLLIGIVLLIVLCGRREGFNPVTERPSTTDHSIRAVVKSYANLPDDSDPKIGKYITAIQEYYDTKFLPEKTSNSAKIAEFLNGQRDPDIDKPTLARILDYIFLTTDSTGTTAPPPPAGATGTTGATGATGATGTTGATGGTGTTGATTPSSSALSKFSQRVWGPAFVELGQGDGSNGDSTKTTVYPELLGGLGDRYEGGEGGGPGD
jgi:hypothetical protein